MKKLYYNSGYFFLVLFAFVLAGFYKTYFGLFPAFDKSTNALVHIHAALLVAWVVLLIVQPLLIRYKKTKLHKRIGKLTYVLVPLIVCSMVGMMLKILTEIPPNPGLLIIFANIKFALFDCILFVTFYTLAIVRRKNFQQHGAFMIATGLVFINPSLSRLLYYITHLPWPVAETIAVILIDLIVLSLLLYFRQQKLSTKPYGFVLLAFLCTQLIITSLVIWGPPV